jgi:hypothetical protein
MACMPKVVMLAHALTTNALSACLPFYRASDMGVVYEIFRNQTALLVV